jgi:hypothetical protein
MGQTVVVTSLPGKRGWQPMEGHHYTVAVVRWVRNRPGERRYIVLRIPASTAERVYRETVAS